MKVVIDDTLVRRLVAGQFPCWAELPIRPVAQSGWDNRTFHLGEHMIVRLPSASEYAAQVEKEHWWLPRLAPLLPLPNAVERAQSWRIIHDVVLDHRRALLSSGSAA